jgi:hypothetical protein
MRRREAGRLAIDMVEPHEVAASDRTTTHRVPLTELAEAGAEQASAALHRGPPREIRGPEIRRMREA